MTIDEIDRLRTWVVAIVETLRPESDREDRGTDWRFTSSGGLTIAKASGAWFLHSAGLGSYDPLRLIAHLRQCTLDEAAVWGATWLESHAGTGSCSGGVEADEAAVAAAAARAAYGQELLGAAVDPTDTAAAENLRSRGINPMLPSCVKYVAGARIGEGAMLGVLTAHDTAVGVQVTYLDPAGRKSLRPPILRHS
jgi:hypothetical protein